MEHRRLEKGIVAQLANNFPAIYEPEYFNAVYINSHLLMPVLHLTNPFHVLIFHFVKIYPAIGLPSGFFLSSFPE
jgi:hypothetical protein